MLEYVEVIPDAGAPIVTLRWRDAGKADTYTAHNTITRAEGQGATLGAALASLTRSKYAYVSR